MKTDYKILWIDDEHDLLVGIKDKFADFFNSYGIRLEIKPIEVKPDEKVTESQFFQEVIEDIELDIVLIDFNMSESGDEIINHIRQNLHHYHIPIIFYSGDGPQKLQEEIIKANTDNQNISDGIYFCDKNYLFNKAEKILSSLLKREEIPKRVRGLLMDRVSEIDATILELLNSECLNKLTEEDTEQLKKYILEKVSERCSDARKMAEAIESKNFNEIVEYVVTNRRFDSYFRANLLRKILQIQHSSCANVLAEFYDPNKKSPCLSGLRNVYAHQTETEIGKTHTSERCKYIREETRRHLDNLGSLERDSSSDT